MESVRRNSEYKSMRIPVFIRQSFVDNDGNLLSPIQQFFDEFFQEAQQNLSNNGLVTPSLTTSEISDVSNPAAENTMPNGTLWYDTDTNELKIKVNDAVRIIQLV